MTLMTVSDLKTAIKYLSAEFSTGKIDQFDSELYQLVELLHAQVLQLHAQNGVKND